MERKASVDTFGAIALIGFALLLAFNQVVIKVTNGGFGPVFLAGIRSFGAIFVLLIWMHFKGTRLALPPGAMPFGVLAGVLFGFEFMCLFNALDMTTVSRASVIFYSMPVWLALVLHFLMPQERLSGARIVGLVLAMLGVGLAMLDRSHGSASLLGDSLALIAAFGWTGIILVVRLGPLSTVAPEVQLFWQVCVSAPILLIAAPFFGPLIRDIQPIHLAGLVFQIIAVASLGFLFWFWLIKLYPANSVASFSFLSPVFSVLLGWWLLDEHVGRQIWLALALVAAGIFLINFRKKA